MSLFGKIFVVLNFLMAILLMFIIITLYAKKVQHKAESELWRYAWHHTEKTSSEQKKNLKEEVQELKTVQTVLEDQNRGLITRIEDMNTLWLDQKAEHDQAVSERDKFKRQFVAAEEELRKRHDRIRNLQEVLLKQHESVTVALRNMNVKTKESEELRNRLNQVEQELRDVMTDKGKVEEMRDHHMWVLDVLHQKGVPVERYVWGTDRSVFGPSIAAKVLAVNRNSNLVILNKGSDEKVRIGDSFTVYRGNKYVARVQVTRVWPDMASARILPAYKRAEIAVNDDANTRPQ